VEAQDGPLFMAEEAKTFGYPFPYLYDEVRTLSRDLPLYSFFIYIYL
jgi:hypothetical protein